MKLGECINGSLTLRLSFFYIVSGVFLLLTVCLLSMCLFFVAGLGRHATGVVLHLAPDRVILSLFAYGLHQHVLVLQAHDHC